MSTIKRITFFLTALLLIFTSVFTFSSCSKKIETVLTMKYLSEEDYLSGDYESKLSDSITTGVDTKSYVVMDYSMKNLKRIKKKKGDRILTAEFYVSCVASDKADFSMRVEEFPTNKYDFTQEKEYQTYNVDIEMYEGIEDEMNYRFIISLSKPIPGEITVRAGVSFRYNSAEVSEGANGNGSASATGKIVIDGSIVTKVGLDLEPSSDGSYYIVAGVGSEREDSIRIPEKYNDIPVKEIAANAFINVNSVKEIVLPEGIEKIGASAFKGCTGVEWFVIPSSVAEVGKDTFAECPNAVMWCVGSSKPDGWSESWKDDVSPVIWDSGRFFKKNDGKTTYTFTFLDDKFAYDTLSIPETYLGGFVTGISGDGEHEAISGIKTLKIPSRVESIGSYAFYNCAELTEIVYNAINCGNLDSRGHAFSNAGANESGITVTFGNGVKNIPSYLFCTEINGTALNVPNIKTVNIGQFVEKICDYAFRGCVGIKTVAIGGGIIGNGVFTGCTSLESLTLGEDVTKIGNTAFRYCTSLKSVVIGKNITSIGNYAFDGCTGLESVRFTGTGTWYTTKSSYDSSSSESNQMNVMTPSENARNLSSVYSSVHWFKA